MIVGWILSLLAVLASGAEPEQQKPNASQPASASPYWRRAGCHLVGHTRTISIPGCVRFNLSTNACRGYCMSYSIPSFDNLSPLGLEEPQQALTLEAAAPNKSQSDSQLIKRQLERNPTVPRREPAGPRTTVLTLPRPDSAKAGSPEAQQPQQQQQQQQQQTPAASGETEKRDVVSVSQCCNMMDSDEVVVNLRCGVSEVRRLVFKSAKKCECFFCKHV